MYRAVIVGPCVPLCAVFGGKVGLVMFSDMIWEARCQLCVIKQAAGDKGHWMLLGHQSALSIKTPHGGDVKDT